ncbi:MAG: hypothetical protein R3F56_11340 [Planctomycetota bacterium]
MTSFLLAPLGAGVALAVNDNRLGNKERAPLTFYAFFFVALLCYLALARLHVEHIVSFRTRAGWLAARAALGVVAILLSLVWSRGQMARFESVRRAHGRGGRPLPVCLPALVASVFVDMLVWQIFLRR